MGTDLLGTQDAGINPVLKHARYRRQWLVISLRQVEAFESVNVEFNEYVPLTITWSSASEVLETAKVRRAAGRKRLPGAQIPPIFRDID